MCNKQKYVLLIFDEQKFKFYLFFISMLAFVTYSLSFLNFLHITFLTTEHYKKNINEIRKVVLKVRRKLRKYRFHRKVSFKANKLTKQYAIKTKNVTSHYSYTIKLSMIVYLSNPTERRVD